MFCPNCKCEYIRGVKECAECGVALVDQLPPDEPESSLADVRIVPVWRGKDAGEFERVQEALSGAGIAFTTPDAKSSLFLPTDPQEEIWVAEKDQDAAESIILEIEGLVDREKLAPEQLEALALPESDDEQDDTDGAGAESDLEQQWDEEEPVSEVWAGEFEDAADTLSACLREVGIASRKTAEAGQWRLVVRPARELRAKQIVREVVEASPPE